MPIALKLATVDTPEAWDACEARPLVYARAGLPTAPRRTPARRFFEFFGRCVRPLLILGKLALFLIKLALRLALVLLAVALIIAGGIVRFAFVTLAHGLLALPKVISRLAPRLGGLRPGRRVPYARLA